MLKQTSARLIALFCAVLLTVALAVGCNRTPASESDVSSASSEDAVTSTDDSAPSEGSDSAVTSGGQTPSGTSGAASSAASTANGGNRTSAATAATTRRSSSQSSPFAGTAEQALAAMPKKLRNTKLTYFYWWDPYQMTEKTAIEKFTAKTGIKVEAVVCSYSDRMTELSARITSGNSPDIVRVLTNAMYQVAALQPITNCGYDFSDDIWWQKMMKDFTFNGKIYATNIRPKDTVMLDTFMLYYNKRALRAADLEDPYTLWKKNPSQWTWKKLLSMCETFKQQYVKKNDYAGMALAYNNAYVRLFGCANYDYNANTGKWENYMDNPELQKRWSEFLKYGENGIVKVQHGGKTAFHRGMYLFYGNGPYACRTGDPTHQVLKDANLLGVVPFPTDTPKQMLYEYTGFGIAQGARNPEAVPYYLRYVYDESSYDLNSVYINEEAKTVCEYTNDLAETKAFFGENENYKMWAQLVAGGPDQVKSVLKSYYGVIQASVDESNAQIATLAR